jgi:leader peptidase (prepilin peptidase)/N-methyltransferase
MLWEWLTNGSVGLLVLDLAAVGFLVVFGANVGSFLNVVAYRVPQGMSVVFGGSHCPTCDRAIRPWHNLPVVGWLILGGRCRDCLVPIPVRYPLVEAVAAMVIGGVSSVELLSGGINLPAGNEVSQEIWWRGVDSLLMHPNWRLVAICLLHVSGLATLLAWSLIERDHQRLLGGWWLGSLVLLLALQMAAPWLQPVGPGLLEDWLDRVTTGPPPAWQTAGLAGLTGILAGGLLGVVLRKLQLTGNLAGQGLALVGGLCGWQATVTTAVLWIAATVLRRVVAPAMRWKLSSERDNWLAIPRLLLADLVVALTLQLLAWRWLDGFSRGLLGRLVVMLEW